MAGWIGSEPVYHENLDGATLNQKAVELNALALELTRLAPYGLEQRLVCLYKETMLPLITELQEKKKTYEKLNNTPMPRALILPDDVIREISKRCDKVTKAQTLILTKKGLVPKGYSKQALKEALSDRKNPFNLKKIREILEKHPDLMKTQRSLSVVCNLAILNTDGALKDLLTHKLKSITELFIENRQIWRLIHGTTLFESKLEMKHSMLKTLSLSGDAFFNLKNIPQTVEELTLTSRYIDHIQRSIISLSQSTISKLKKLNLGLILNYTGKKTNEIRKFMDIIEEVSAAKVMDVTYNLAAKYEEVAQRWDETGEYTIEQLALVIIELGRNQLKPGQKITVNYDTTENGVEAHKTISFTK